jgi:diadenosine tetraphosphatase ApaH/serine/threonine PP2A family protein phosphatase
MDLLHSQLCNFVHNFRQLIRPPSQISIPISGTLAYQIVCAGQSRLNEDPNVLDLNGQFVVVGDLHGNLQSLLSIFNRLRWPPSTSYLFLGDYVDRGSNSCEVILLLYALKFLYPTKVYLIRGNHEFSLMTDNYGFHEEVQQKFSESFYYAVTSSFDCLPIGAVLNREAFCVHGGVSPQLHSVDDIRKLPKPCQDTLVYGDPISDLLWGDPTNEVGQFQSSPRGCAYEYGPIATKQFLANSGLKYLIRAHQTCEHGFRWDFGYRAVLTVFSSHDYCGMGNSAAALRVSEQGQFQFFRFPPVVEVAPALPTAPVDPVRERQAAEPEPAKTLSIEDALGDAWTESLDLAM